VLVTYFDGPEKGRRRPFPQLGNLGPKLTEIFLKLHAYRYVAHFHAFCDKGTGSHPNLE